MSVPIPPAAPGARGAPDHAVRQQIVVAATEHFRTFGYEKTTVSELASSIGYSKAYIYKFFGSKQAIGEVICGNCLQGILSGVEQSLGASKNANDAIRRMFSALVDGAETLFNEERRLYDIAAAAARDRWPVVNAYVERLRELLVRIVKAGREAGDFERKTPLDDVVDSIFLVMHPYINPLMLQYGLDQAKESAVQVSGLVLRSLAP